MKKDPKDSASDAQDRLLDQLDAEEGTKSSEGKLPPVHLWNPQFSGDMDMRITREGEWLYQGSPITRQPMVNLFSTILKLEEGSYYLVTPVEKFRIQVDVLPFVAVEMKLENQGSPTQTLWFKTNVGDWVAVDKDHDLKVEEGDDGEPIPSIHVRSGLRALIHRNVFYELVEMATSVSQGETNKLVIHSGGEDYCLGEY